MQQVTLGATSIRCSALGFGCVKLTTHDSRADAVRVLNVALDMGITHFDVARLYGQGHAEGILGEFLRGKRDKVTVATKFGLKPSETLSKHRMLVSFARKTLRRLPMLEKIVKRKMASGPPQKGLYSREEASQSLDRSLRELGVDYVDIFLLHEADLADAQNSELLEFLDGEVERGRIRAYGIGSGAHHLGEDWSKIPPQCQVLQFDNSLLQPNLTKLSSEDRERRGVITFGVMSPARTIREYLASRPAAAKGFSDRAQLDFTDHGVLARLLVDDAVRSNPSGVTLFASVNPKNIQANIRAGGGAEFADEQRAMFGELVQAVRAAL